MDVMEASASYAGLTKLPGDAVPLGCKRTEVGAVPTDWLVVQAGELRPFVTSGSRGWATFYSDTGAPFIRITNLGRDCIYPDLQDLRFVKLDESTREGMRTQLQTGDVLISITADIGIVGYVDSRVPTPAYINQHIALMRFDDPRISSKYLSYFWAAENSQRVFRAMTDSGAKAGMNLTTVKQILLAAPPTRDEQEAIAEALSDADALIESLEQLIAKKRRIKQGTMQALLTGKQRLLGFSGEWQRKTIGEVFSITTGYSKSSYIDVGGDSWIVDMGSVSIEGKLVVSKATNYTNDFLGLGDLVMPKDDIGGGGIIGKVGYIDADHVYVLGDHVYRLVAHCGSSRFLAYVINGHKTNSELRKKVIGSAQLGLGRKSVECQEISFPSLEEQIAIATVLSDMDTELAELETRLAKTRQLKQGMMQELLTGRIRLVQPASTVAPLPKKKEPRAATAKPHNPQINEAVVIAALTKHFGSEDWPLARVRRTKLAYLLHRHAEGRADGFLKKAAGPYDPRTRYKGPEGIALKKGYVRTSHNGKYEGFVASENIAEADAYFEKWYGADAMAWLEQFHMRKTEELELLTTVDMAVEDLRREGKSISMDAVKQLIHDHPEWKPKLDRPVFSDAGIAGALAECQALFASL